MSNANANNANNANNTANANDDNGKRKGGVSKAVWIVPVAVVGALVAFIFWFWAMGWKRSNCEAKRGFWDCWLTSWLPNI